MYSEFSAQLLREANIDYVAAQAAGSVHLFCPGAYSQKISLHLTHNIHIFCSDFKF